MKQRYFLELAFDGTNYFGWQIQANHITVQEIINTVLSKLFNTEIAVVGCGRTDTGVHASQYFAHFDAPEKRDNLFLKLKIMLPKDIDILNVFEVKADAHARYDATERSYKYHLHNKKDIFNSHYSLSVDLKAFDTKKILKACTLFEQYQDYSALSKKNLNLDNSLSNVTEAVWEVNNDKAIFTVKANRFLHNQIRRMLGALINIGLNKMTLTELEDALKNGTKLRLNDTVSPKGLFLNSIKYPYI